MTWRERVSIVMAAGGLMVGTARGQADLTVLDFEDIPGCPLAPDVTPAASRLSDAYVATHRIAFASTSPFIGVADVGAYQQAVSGHNVVLGSSATDILSGAYPVIGTFTDGSEAYVTDYVAASPDLSHRGYPMILKGYNMQGELIASMTAADGAVLSIAAPAIHRFELTSADRTVAFDKVSFHSPSPVLEPAALGILTMGLPILALRHRRWSLQV